MKNERTHRQMRSMPIEFRAEDTDGKKVISGYFAVFGSTYELWPGATESIAPTAFDGALEGDIRALIDHETRLVLGRTRAGTLALKVDNYGLWSDITINEEDTDAMNLYARVQRGDVSQASFGFEILEERTDFNNDGSVHWTIEKVKLYEISCVTFPAYQDTSVSARKEQYAEIRRRQADEWREKMKARVKNA